MRCRKVAGSTCIAIALVVSALAPTSCGRGDVGAPIAGAEAHALVTQGATLLDVRSSAEWADGFSGDPRRIHLPSGEARPPAPEPRTASRGGRTSAPTSASECLASREEICVVDESDTLRGIAEDAEQRGRRAIAAA